MLHVKYVLYFYINTFQCMCAVPNMAVFCTSLISYFSAVLVQILLLLLLLLLYLSAVSELSSEGNQLGLQEKVMFGVVVCVSLLVNAVHACITRVAS